MMVILKIVADMLLLAILLAAIIGVVLIVIWFAFEFYTEMKDMGYDPIKKNKRNAEMNVTGKENK